MCTIKIDNINQTNALTTFYFIILITIIDLYHIENIFDIILIHI